MAAAGHAPGVATIYDVAGRARVSHQTVSRVINGGRGVAADTRERVLGAAAELGYVVNRSARNLGAGRSLDRGIVVVADHDGAWRVPPELGRELRAAGGAVLVEFVDADGPEVTAAVARLSRQVGDVVVVRPADVVV